MLSDQWLMRGTFVKITPNFLYFAPFWAIDEGISPLDLNKSKSPSPMDASYSNLVEIS